MPRLPQEGIQYEGVFRLPAQTVNGDSFAIGGRQVVFNPASNSLFVGTRAGRIAEVTIPAPVKSANINDLPFASYLQPFVDPTEGHISEITGVGPAIDGLLIYKNRLFGTASIYYDALNTQRFGHYSRSLQLNEPSFSGWSAVWDPTRTGYVDGVMANVPAEWQQALGGPAITGQCCIPIVTRTSWGPAAFAFDPAQIGTAATLSATPLLYYTGEHQTLGNWDGSSPAYGATTQINGAVIVAGTRTLLYFGRNGMGPNCYGNGTADQSLVGTLADDGAHYCYDPVNNSKGTHGYPYRYQMWAYDLNDLAAVKAGTKQPWDVLPYGVWELTLPTPEETFQLGGVGYDASTQTLYVSQLLADRDGYEYRPLIHVFHVDATPALADPNSTTGTQPSTTTSSSSTTTQISTTTQSSTTTTATTTQPATTTQSTTTSTASAVVGLMSLSVNKTAPQVAGTAITFTANANGAADGYQYKFLVHDGTSWTVASPWSTTATFTWTPTRSSASYKVAAWARSTGNSLDEAELSASTAFAITASATTSARVTSVSVTADKSAPQAVGAAITFSAVAAGGVAPLQYKWLVYDGSPTWKVVSNWSASNTFTWTPASANAEYRVGVWVRGATNAQDAEEASSSMAFAIAAGSTTQAPTGASSTATVMSVAITASKPAPQAVGTAVTFTAAAVSGVAPLQYKWLLYDGSPTWKVISDWSASNTFTWTPALANAEYQIGVWVRSSGNTQDVGEATRAAGYSITAPVAPVTTTSVTPVVTTTTTSVTPVTTASGPTVTPQSLSVQPGATITFTAVNGNGNNMSWIALYAAGAADFRNYLQWQFMNATQNAPSTGITSATLRFTAPQEPGTYNIRWFGDSGYTRIATSATITVVGSSTPTATTTTTTTTSTTTAATACATCASIQPQSLSVKAGAVIKFTAANGNGNNLSWLALYASGADDYRNYLQWNFMNGTQTAPAGGIVNGSFQFTAPTTPGTYNIRWFGDGGYTRIATSTTITVTQ